MKFKDRFKVGDIIRRGGFIRTGQLMIVEEFKSERDLFNGKIAFDEAYSCQDLFLGGQKWSASEKGEFTLATDQDIIDQIVIRVTFSETCDSKYGELVMDSEADCICLSDNWGDNFIYLDPLAAIKVRDFINKYVEEL
jgi:hypothetical protein